MALPSSGSISIDDIRTELGITGALDLTDSRVRTLAGVPSGSITLPNDLWGKSNFNAYAAPAVIIASGISRNGKPALATGSTTIHATPSDGVTYTWTHQSDGSYAATFSPSGASCSVRYGSTYYSTATGTITCVASRAGASKTIVIPYDLHIDSDQIGPEG